VLLAGCAAHPELAPAPVPAVAFRNAGADAGKAAGADWWEGFGDPALLALVRRAEDANLDVRSAAERVREARAGLGAANAALKPSVELTGSESASHSGLPAAVKQVQPDVVGTRGAVELDWDIDLFGSNRAAAAAAGHDAKAAADGVEVARLEAGAEVARDYLQWRDAGLRLQRLQAMLADRRSAEALTRERAGAGLASAMDVDAAVAQRAELEASLPQLQALRAAQEAAIAVLVGADPAQPLPELGAAPSAGWPELPPLPVGVPAELLQRRPDLLAAQQQLEAASARSAQARSDLYPKIFLSAVFGQQQLDLNNTLDLPASGYSNVALAFAMPIFNNGRIRAGIAAQESRERAADLHYAQVELGALRDVESALAVLHADRARLTALQERGTARESALRRAAALRAEGQIDELALLQARAARDAAQLDLLQGQAQIALDDVQLYQALGGGWPRQPSPTTDASPARHDS
jgi:NodT family efflux transporter outer membrane factor (OMF) lipoprotein